MEGAKLKDMLGYEAESYYSKDELTLIRNTFNDNPALMKVLRKTFIPTIQDPELPIEEFAKDAFLVGKSWSQIAEKERGPMILARQEAIEFIMGGLIFLKNTASIKPVTEEEQKAKRKKDSSQ